MHIQESGNEHWYTPPAVIAMIKRWLGGTIELDVCSSPAANEIVGATRFFTEADDAIDLPWRADTVYMNPPYSRRKIKPFCNKFVVEYAFGAFKKGVVLVNNFTETEAGQLLASYANAAFFPDGRIRFLTPDLKPTNTPVQGQVLYTFGFVPTLDRELDKGILFVRPGA